MTGRLVKCPNKPTLETQDRRGPNCAAVGTAGRCPNGGRWLVRTDDGEDLRVCGVHANKAERRGELEVWGLAAGPPPVYQSRSGGIFHALSDLAPVAACDQRMGLDFSYERRAPEVPPRKRCYRQGCLQVFARYPYEEPTS